MRNRRPSPLQNTALVLVLIVGCLCLLSISLSYAEETPSKAPIRSSYVMGRSYSVEKPYKRAEDGVAPERVFVTRSERVDDKIPVPTWKAPNSFRDRTQDLPKIMSLWRRIRRDPAIKREAASLYKEPHFMGRNAIPLSEVEQIVLDQPRAIRTRELPMLDMVTATLARGTINTFCGWLEIPRSVDKHLADKDPFSSAVFGFCEGAARTVVRTSIGIGEIGIGVTDLATFRWRRPEKLDHRPLIEPENIVTEMWGRPLPVVCDPRHTFYEPVIPSGY